MLNTVLFPSSYFDGRKVDEDLQKEYDAVVNTGLYNIIIFHYDKWFNEQKLVLTQVPEQETVAVYRGWMMKPEMYKAFYSQLEDKNIQLITTPEKYEHFHVFPNVYLDLQEDTARMLVYPKGKEINLDEVKQNFKRFMVKDYVKSVKGTEFPRYFESDVSQEEFDKWMEVFYKYRGNLFTGGICIKEFLPLKFYNSKSNEYRVYYIKNEIATISRNSGQENDTPLPPQELLEKYKNLDSIFYTIDYAELEDGSWRILEAGDGGVSGLSDYQDYETFFRTMYHCFR